MLTWGRFAVNKAFCSIRKKHIFYQNYLQMINLLASLWIKIFYLRLWIIQLFFFFNMFMMLLLKWYFGACHKSFLLNRNKTWFFWIKIFFLNEINSSKKILVSLNYLNFLNCLMLRMFLIIPYGQMTEVFLHCFILT